MKRDIPFFANTPDDTHCFQAAVKMTLKYYEPETEFTWIFLDEVTHKLPDMWTWTMSGMIWLQNRGYTVRNIEEFNYGKFAAEGANYLIDLFGEEVAAESILHSDIAAEMMIAGQFNKLIQTEQRLPDFTDIRQLLDEEFIVITLINARVLNGSDGYVGHFVVITDCNNDYITCHDPGLPAQPQRKVSVRQFEDAWAYPDRSSKNLLAITRL